jgi:RNA polymerase sigma-70 factor, ECF subfamily
VGGKPNNSPPTGMDVAANKAALDRLWPYVDAEVRRLAQKCLLGEQPGHTLQATAVANNVYLRLVEGDVPVQDCNHLLRLATTAIRRVFVDHARHKKRAKRGAGARRESLESAERELSGKGTIFDHDALDIALQELRRLDPRQEEVVILRFYGGLSMLQIADLLGIADSTASAAWKIARAFLGSKLRSGNES